MNLKKCSNGHYYDADKYPDCPHCNKNADADDEKTFIMSQTSQFAEERKVSDYTEIQSETPEHGALKSGTLRGAVEAVGSTMHKLQDDDDKTVRYFGGSVEKEPVVGWVVCIKGDDLGNGFELKTGKNFIGRSASMDIVLKNDSTVSRDRHAIVTYEPKGRRFIAQPGESRELFYLNNEVVLENIELSYGDELLIGKTTLKFVPFCGPDFCWEK